MSILIPGMKMPKDCRECPFFGYTAEDNFMCLIQNGEDTCRLEELPPHGRLIDADKVCKSFQAQTEIIRKWGIDELTEIADLLEKGFLQEIENAKTIIQAEGGADG